MAEFKKTYLNCGVLIKLNPVNDSDKNFNDIFTKLGLNLFLPHTFSLTFNGYNKKSTGRVSLTLTDKFNDAPLSELSRTFTSNKEIRQYLDQRDEFLEYLLRNKWIPIEVYFLESNRPISYKKDLFSIDTNQLKTLSKDIKAYKMFDGVAHEAEVDYTIDGHFINMNISDRLVLLENDMIDGKLKNSNSTEILKTLASRVGLELVINEGITFSQNLYTSGNQTVNVFTNKKENFKMLNQNLGKHSNSFPGETVSEDFLVNSEESLNIVSKIAKMEGAVYYCVGKKLYFGGINKRVTQTLEYTWGEDIFDIRFKPQLPKPLKESFPYYIEIKGFNAGTKTPIVVSLGKKPPKSDSSSGGSQKKIEKKEGENLLNNVTEPGTTTYINSNLDNIGGSSSKGGSKGRSGQPDETSNTIFIYQTYTGLTQDQLKKIAENIEETLKFGAVQAILKIPIDYSITPFDSIKFVNVGKPFERLVFNIEQEEFSFNVASGLSQTVKLTTAHENFLDEKSAEKVTGKKVSENKGVGDTGYGLILTEQDTTAYINSNLDNGGKNMTIKITP